MDDAKIVHADMGKLRATRNLPDCPYARRSSLQSFVDFNISTVRQFDTSQLQSKPLGIWGAPCRYQHMSAVHDLLSSLLIHADTDGSARLSCHLLNPRI